MSVNKHAHNKQQRHWQCNVVRNGREFAEKHKGTYIGQSSVNYRMHCKVHRVAINKYTFNYEWKSREARSIILYTMQADVGQHHYSRQHVVKHHLDRSWLRQSFACTFQFQVKSIISANQPTPSSITNWVRWTFYGTLMTIVQEFLGQSNCR